jgi:hypothetical protein
MLPVLAAQKSIRTQFILSLFMDDEEKHPACPECGSPLSHVIEIDEDTGEIVIGLFCEGAGEDEFNLSISTGLSNKDLKRLKKAGKTTKKVMQIKLIERKKDPYSE